MLVHVIVDPDACIGSAECVALDPEAVELDEHGTAHILSRARGRTREPALRRLPRRCPLDGHRGRADIASARRAVRFTPGLQSQD